MGESKLKGRRTYRPARRRKDETTNLGRRQTFELMPTALAAMDERIGPSVRSGLGAMVASSALPPDQQLLCFTCSEPWSLTRCPDYTLFVESLDRLGASSIEVRAIHDAGRA